MAVLNNKKQKVSDEIPTSSMADIAFLLLIFFHFHILDRKITSKIMVQI